MAWWAATTGKLELELTLDEAHWGSHSGDCEADVRELLAEPHIASQVRAWAPKDVRDNLWEYGAWDEAELEDEEMNLVRTLWLACGELADGEGEPGE